MYVSGEIANNALRKEPVMVPLVAEFRDIQEKYGERFDDTFKDEFKKLVRGIVCDVAQYLAALDTEEALPEPKEATVPEQPAFRHEPRHDAESVFWVLVGCLVRALPDGTDNNPADASD